MEKILLAALASSILLLANAVSASEWSDSVEVYAIDGSSIDELQKALDDNSLWERTSMPAPQIKEPERRMSFIFCSFPLEVRGHNSEKNGLI